MTTRFFAFLNESAEAHRRAQAEEYEKAKKRKGRKSKTPFNKVFKELQELQFQFQKKVEEMSKVSKENAELKSQLEQAHLEASTAKREVEKLLKDKMKRKEKKEEKRKEKEKRKAERAKKAKDKMKKKEKKEEQREEKRKEKEKRKAERAKKAKEAKQVELFQGPWTHSERDVGNFVVRGKYMWFPNGEKIKIHVTENGQVMLGDFQATPVVPKVITWQSPYVEKKLYWLRGIWPERQREEGIKGNEAAAKQTASTSSTASASSGEPKGVPKTPEPKTAEPMPVQNAKQAELLQGLQGAWTNSDPRVGNFVVRENYMWFPNGDKRRIHVTENGRITQGDWQVTQVMPKVITWRNQKTDKEIRWFKDVCAKKRKMEEQGREEDEASGPSQPDLADRSDHRG